MKLGDLIKDSVTDELSLDEVLRRLRKQPEIDGVLLAGTTGKESIKPYSDYDLLIVLNEMAEPPSLMITTIDGTLTELYFLKAKTADRLLDRPDEIESNTLHGAFVSMIAKGEIVYDASGRLSTLQQIAPQTKIERIVDHQRYSSWYSLTYNHAQNLRYFHSGDPLYLAALQCRLLYCISNCLSVYFTLRGMPWRGEKVAIRYLQANDLPYLEQFQATVTAGSIAQQFPHYERLVALTLPDGFELWGEDYTVVQGVGGLTAVSIQNQIEQWESWIETAPTRNDTISSGD